MGTRKSIISLITAAVMWCALSGSVCADATQKNYDDISKISDGLLEELGTSRTALSTEKERRTMVCSNTQPVSVIVWTANEINHEAVEKQILPILRSDLESKDVKGLENVATLNDIRVYGSKLSKDAVQSFIATERELSRSMYTELNDEFIEKNLSDAEVTFVSQYSPVIIADLNLEGILSLAKCNDVVKLDFNYCSVEMEQEDPLDVSTVSTNAIQVATQIGYGYTGSGINIGMIESALPELNDVQLSPIASDIHLSNNQNLYGGNHATFDAIIMVGQAVNGYSRGMAPNADLYAATCNDFNGQDFEAIEWLMTQGANVINASHPVGHYTDHNAYNSYAQWLDHIANEHYVTFVQSSGNVGSTGVISGGMAYNIITVGNVDDNNTPYVSDDDLYSTSSYYSANTSLAYKPDLCAPGTAIINSASPSGSTGTSASAPHVTGAVALLFEANYFSMLEPALVKAFLTACVNPGATHIYRPIDNDYQMYGAGLLDIFRVIEASKQGNYEVGCLPYNNYYYETFAMPINATGKKIRVSMAFLQNEYAHSAIPTEPLQDLDLYIYDPNGLLVAKSITSDNNVEIASFTSQTTGQYTIKVTRVSSSYTRPVDYGVAWMETS